ncbi:MAG: hypothetical protein EXR72_20210 [Myxococcales bacterium]|nr:hypothetical protein [Myxococcales bacterium]
MRPRATAAALAVVLFGCHFEVVGLNPTDPEAGGGGALDGGKPRDLAAGDRPPDAHAGLDLPPGADLSPPAPPPPDLAGCGAFGQLCCNGACGQGLGCASGTCVTCGEKNAPCCGGNGCNAQGTVCHKGTCLICGGLTQPCCPGWKCPNGASHLCILNICY